MPFSPGGIYLAVDRDCLFSGLDVLYFKRFVSETEKILTKGSIHTQ